MEPELISSGGAGAAPARARSVTAFPKVKWVRAEEPIAIRLARRFIEINFAFWGLLLTTPVALVLAILIRRDSPGPAVFRQTRV